MSTRLRSPFAFLGRSAAASDDDKDDKNKSKSKAEEKDDDDEDDEKKKDKKDDDAKSKKAKAEDGDDEDYKKKKDDDEDDDKAKGKKAKASDDDDEDKGSDAKAARARERSRIRAILTSPAGQADPVAAAHVALDTGMPRADAIAMLTAMQLSRDAMGGGASAGAGRSGLRERMEDVANPQVGADGGKPGGPTMAERIIAAGNKARGEA